MADRGTTRALTDAQWKRLAPPIEAVRLRGVLAVNPGGFWAVADTGDYNGDGRADILWRGADGRVVVWEMNGGAVTGVATLGALTNDWQVVSA
jgi:hypothetical protein